jgi:uncharacterized damage-inducible protein DinB
MRAVSSFADSPDQAVPSYNSCSVITPEGICIMTQKRPEPGEYSPYYESYVKLVPDDDLLSILETQLQETRQLLASVSESDANFRYGPNKWSIKEILGHLTDTERIFGYRILRIARADQTPLSGFEQDDYVRAGNFSARSLTDLLEEFSVVRRATMALLRSLNDLAWLRRGVANQKEISVRALAYVLAGHERHHRRILEERYLAAMTRP